MTARQGGRQCACLPTSAHACRRSRRQFTTPAHAPGRPRWPACRSLQGAGAGQASAARMPQAAPSPLVNGRVSPFARLQRQLTVQALRAVNPAVTRTSSRAVSQQRYPLPAMTDELDTRWRPLSVRKSGDHAAYDALDPGVPDYLFPSLWAWIQRRVLTEHTLQQIERRCRIKLSWYASRTSATSSLENLMRADEQLCLNVVDFLASRIDPDDQTSGMSREAREAWLAELADLVSLDLMLEEAGSLWTADNRSKPVRLVQRVEPTLRAAAEQVMSIGDKAAQHLRLAWHAVYGRQPDSGKGYREAIKAMEVATIPVVCPNNTRATLNRVINDLRAKPSKWAVNLKHPTPDRQVETVADMLDLVWKGQSDRHGDPDPNAPISVSQEQAEAAVHLAVTVVQWFTRGVVTAR